VVTITPNTLFNNLLFFIKRPQSNAAKQTIESDSEAHGALWLITAAAARVAAYRFNA